MDVQTMVPALARLRQDPAFDRSYELEDVLGHGGTAMVARARHRPTGREVAVKVMDAAGLPSAAERIVREGRLLARLKHPGIVHVYDAGIVGDTPYLVLELATGGSLRDRMERGGAMSAGQLVEIMVPCLRALGELHAAGVLHRDFKPDNVLFTADGQPKLADFGLALGDPTLSRLTATDLFVGTLRYSAPEVIRGCPYTPAGDLYAVGSTIFEMLAGRPVFDEGATNALVASILSEKPRSLATFRDDLPPPLVNLVSRCLEKDPDRRLSSAIDLAAQLTRWKAPGSTISLAHPISVPVVRASRLLPKLSSRALGVGLTLCATALVAAGWLAGTYHHAPRPVPLKMAPAGEVPAAERALLTEAVQHAEHSFDDLLPLFTKASSGPEYVSAPEDLRRMVRPIVTAALPVLDELERRLDGVRRIDANGRLSDELASYHARGVASAFALWYLVEQCRRMTSGMMSYELTDSPGEAAGKTAKERKGLELLREFFRAENMVIARQAAAPQLDGALLARHFAHLFTVGHGAAILDWDEPHAKRLEAQAELFTQDLEALDEGRRPIGHAAKGCWLWGYLGPKAKGRKSVEQARTDVQALAASNPPGAAALQDVVARMTHDLGH
jgi:hypothetical protein